VRVYASPWIISAGCPVPAPDGHHLGRRRWGGRFCENPRAGPLWTSTAGFRHREYAPQRAHRMVMEIRTGRDMGNSCCMWTVGSASTAILSTQKNYMLLLIQPAGSGGYGTPWRRPIALASAWLGGLQLWFFKTLSSKTFLSGLEVNSTYTLVDYVDFHDRRSLPTCSLEQLDKKGGKRPFERSQILAKHPPIWGKPRAAKRCRTVFVLI